MITITQQAGATLSNGGALPFTAVAGRLLVVFMAKRGGQSPIAGAMGWTLRGGGVNASSTSINILTKTAVGGDVLNYTNTGQSNFQCWIFEATGNVVDIISNLVVVFSSTNSGNSMTFPQIPTTGFCQAVPPYPNEPAASLALAVQGNDFLKLLAAAGGWTLAGLINNPSGAPWCAGLQRSDAAVANPVPVNASSNLSQFWLGGIAVLQETPSVPNGGIINVIS